MHALSLTIKNWSAWLPGIDQCGEWCHWGPELAVEAGATPVNVDFIKPMARRRLSGMSRIAMRVAHDCLGDHHIDAAVFCSRHGECVRTLGIYGSIASGEAVSPTQFSQSVHNTAAGVFSIERNLRVPVSAIAAGSASLEHGFIEAWSQIQCGAESVLLVMSDERLDEPFSRYVSLPRFPFGLALLLTPKSKGFRLVLESVESGEVKSGTDNLLALLTGHEQLALEGSNGWCWRLDD